MGRNYSLAQLNLVKYHTWYVLSFFICLLPLPLKWVLTFSLSDKEAAGGHHYSNAYSRYLRPYKYRRIKLLEIGIGGGNSYGGGESLNSWQMYFPFAKIVGADIEEKSQLSNARTRIHRVDQGDDAALTGLAVEEQGFDVILDDGSHLSKHIIGTFKVLFPWLRSGGLYIVEDTQTSYWSFEQWDGCPPQHSHFSTTALGYFTELARYINHMELPASQRQELELSAGGRAYLDLAKEIRSIYFEHNLVIIQKAPNEDLSNLDNLLRTI